MHGESPSELLSLQIKLESVDVQVQTDCHSNNGN